MSVAVTFTADGLEQGSLAAAVSAIGTKRFAAEMARHFRHAVGSENCAFFRLEKERMYLVDRAGELLPQKSAPFDRYFREQLWQRDPTIGIARERCSATPLVIHYSPQEIPDGTIREEIYRQYNVRDRVVICVEQGRALYGISILRSSAMFSEGDIRRLVDEAPLLISSAIRHGEILSDTQHSGLGSLDAIEATLRMISSVLTGREIQVCSRMLYGLSAEGIGLDLGIGTETVATYRKRAYQRLGIATRHELLCLYLDGPKQTKPEAVDHRSPRRGTLGAELQS